MDRLVRALATVAVAVIGVPVSTRAEKWFGHDGSPIVIDEALGMLITLFMLPKSIAIYAVGFLLFRVFDIVKPFPAGRAQALPGGWGVMMDDVLAAIYAHICLRILIATVW
jgi:phosphatidylglycerophosphatase A